MPRGGPRPRSGRKKGSFKLIQGGRSSGTKGPAAPDTVIIDPATARKLLRPPAHLSDGARAAWKRHAPHALAAGTLTPTTAPGFEHLCETVDLREQLRKTIDEEGWQVKTPVLDRHGEVVGHRVNRHQLWPQHAAATVRLQQLYLAYRVMGDGRHRVVEEEEPPKPKPVPNPWSRVGPPMNPYSSFGDPGAPPDEEPDPPA